MNTVTIDNTSDSWQFAGKRTLNLTFKEFQRKGHSVFAVWQNTKGKTYPMFLSEFEKIVTKVQEGAIAGSFEVCKRGEAYGIRHAE
jgi:hypothetical protein